MNEVKLRDEVVIENLIYEIRGKHVMLDSDLARLYECANGTKSINLVVNRNNDLKFQIETSNSSNNHGGVRKLPYVFTEQGVAMLATVLRTRVASSQISVIK